MGLKRTEEFYLPADLPKYAGFWPTPTKTGLSISTISSKNVEKLNQWLAL